VAATDGRNLLAAALALPGILPAVALAQGVPDAGIVSLKYLDYRDWQPGENRMTVKSPSFYVLAPFAGAYAFEGAVVYDAMSGASPLWFNTLSGASGLGITDYRTAVDAKVTRYYDRWSIGVAGVYSHERDYISRGGSLDVRWWTPDKNTTLNFGFGGAVDSISPTDREIDNGQRHTVEFLLGVTQNLSPTQIIQSNLTYSNGHGYYSDPYKPLDRRPDNRQIFAWLTRYNQFFADADGTLQMSYRFINDSFGGKSSAFTLAWVQGLAQGWTITPNLRVYTQSAASFYFNPPYPQGFKFGQYYTADTRLASFGALTGGIKVAKTFADGWTADLRADYYRQNSSWALFSSGSPGIETFSARWIEAGISKTF
jgi:hypothetical protein